MINIFKQNILLKRVAILITITPAMPMPTYPIMKSFSLKKASIV